MHLQPKTKSRGFTLIEIIIVTVILSILASWLVPLVRPLWQPKPKYELEKVKMLFTNAQQKAIYAHKTHLANISREGVLFCEWVNGNWAPLSDAKQRQYFWKTAVDLSLLLNGQPHDVQEEGSCDATILFEPDGLLTHFSLTLINQHSATLTLTPEYELIINE